MNIKITDLVSRSEDGSVHMVFYEASITKDGKTVKLDQNISLFPKDSSDPSFIPYENLTEEKVIEWVLELLTEDGLQDIEDQLIAKLNQPINTSMKKLPWI